MSKDYRNTEYCPKLTELQHKKKGIVQLVKKEHPKAKDMHSYISKNQGSIKNEFMAIYNGKCAYCGVSLQLIPKYSFQIDHFIYQEAPEFNGSKAKAGTINNLVLACNTCNQNKSSYFIPLEERDNLHPDGSGILQCYVRDEDYYIQVSQGQQNNLTVVEFYRKLKLGDEIHRLDYLLMSMMGLRDELQGREHEYAVLSKAIDLLRSKRNLMT